MTTAEVIAIEELLTALAFYSDPRGVLERQGLNPADFGIPDFYDELDFGSRATEAIKNWEAARAAAAEATSAPTPAPVSGEREAKHKIYDELHEWIGVTGVFPQSCSYEYELRSFIDDAFSAATALRTPHVVPGEAIPQAHIITLRNHADKLAEQYGNNAGIVVTLRTILYRLTASREDVKNG